MDTLQIKSILTRLLRKTAQIAVIPSDGLDIYRIKKYPVCLCVNNQPGSMPGEHWLGIYIQKPNDKMYFFCSYGLGMSFYAVNFKQFARRMKLSVVQNKVCLQDLNSDVCGLYVIHFLYKMMKGCCLMSVYCTFSNNKLRNDNIVRRYNKFLLSKSKYKSFTNQSCCKFKHVIK